MTKNNLRNKTNSLTNQIDRITSKIVANNKYLNIFEIRELESVCKQLIDLMKSADIYSDQY